MSKKIFETDANHPMFAYGCLRATPEMVEKVYQRAWQTAFDSCVEIKSDGTLQCYHDNVAFIFNTNIVPQIRDFSGRWRTDQSLPFFHAAAVFLDGDRPVNLIMFCHNDDMLMMSEKFPFGDFILENGQNYNDFTKERRVRFDVIDKKTEPLWPQEWQDVNKYDGYSFTSMPGWPNQKMCATFKEHKTKRAQQLLGQMNDSGLAQCLQQLGCSVEVETPPIRYEIITPRVVIHINHIGVVIDEYKKSLVLIQNDVMIPLDN